MNKTLACTGPVSFVLALVGVAPSGIAAVAQLVQAEARSAHLAIDGRGLHGHLLVTEQTLVHAELRSADLQLADQGGRVLWTGEAALKAMAILLMRSVQIEIGTTNEPVCGHELNVEWILDRALLEMAVAVDEGLEIAALPCTFEPVAHPSTDEEEVRAAITRR